MPESQPNQKSFTSALVLLPSAELLHNVETARRKHDRHVDRWMPHVTLVFPFCPESLHETQLADIFGKVEQVVGSSTSFDMTFDHFGTFDHSSRSKTLYLAPDCESTSTLQALLESLRSLLPAYDDIRPDGVFTPHMTLGQFRTVEQIADVQSEYASLISISRISFKVDSIAWVTRKGFKDRMAVKKLFQLAKH